MDIKNLNLVSGYVYRITTKNHKVKKFIYEYSEEDHYVGHRKKRNPEQIKISISEIIEIELIEKDGKKTRKLILYTLSAAVVVTFIAIGVIVLLQSIEFGVIGFPM